MFLARFLQKGACKTTVMLSPASLPRVLIRLEIQIPDNQRRGYLLDLYEAVCGDSATLMTRYYTFTVRYFVISTLTIIP